MGERKRIALVAQDHRKDDLLPDCEGYLNRDL
jgi:hypothetical protein